MIPGVSGLKLKEHQAEAQRAEGVKLAQMSASQMGHGSLPALPHPPSSFLVASPLSKQNRPLQLEVPNVFLKEKINTDTHTQTHLKSQQESEGHKHTDTPHS